MFGGLSIVDRGDENYDLCQRRQRAAKLSHAALIHVTQCEKGNFAGKESAFPPKEILHHRSTAIGENATLHIDAMIELRTIQ